MMQEFEYWRLCERLTLIQAALLLSNHDPAGHEQYIEGWDKKNQPSGYPACRQAIIAAIQSESVDGVLHYDEGFDTNGEPYANLAPERSHVDVQSLTNWLFAKGIRSGFFFPDAATPRDYLNPGHPRYAPKLAAAVAAWEALEDPKSLRGKTPKQGLEKWLRENASKYDLCSDDGAPIESAITAIAKITNWKPKGGAPETPGAEDSSPNVVTLKPISPPQGKKAVAGAFELDDDMPF